MRSLLLSIALGLVAAPGGAQSIYGSVRNAAGPIAGVNVRFQYFPTAACKRLSGMTTEMTTAQKAEFDACAKQLPPKITAKDGTYEATGLKPGWYSVSFKWRLAAKPKGNAPFGRYDGYVVLHTGGRSADEYDVVALPNEPVEVKAGSRIERRFFYRP